MVVFTPTFLRYNIHDNSFFYYKTGVCSDICEGGLYIGPEFQLGQVYDGTYGTEEGETVVLYRPVYVCVRRPQGEKSANENGGNDPGPSGEVNGSNAAAAVKKKPEEKEEEKTWSRRKNSHFIYKF